MNILGQNPDFHVTPTSGILDILVGIRNNWNQNLLFKAIPFEQSEMQLSNVLRHTLKGYFAHVDKRVCFDKSRGWLEFLELASVLVGSRENVRVLVTVRDLRDVCASFEKLYRSTAATGQIPQEQADHTLKMKTALGRLEVFIDNGQPVGRAFNAIRDAVTRGWRKNMLFIEYEALTRDPASVMQGVYLFLNEKPFPHDFENVAQLTYEDDALHGFKDLHKIRQKVRPQPPQWPDVYDKTVLIEPIWKRVEDLARFWSDYVKLDVAKMASDPMRK